MKLHDLLPESVGTPFGGLEITDVTSDSRRICAGCAFVCVEGPSFDGHDYAKEAEQNGANIIVAHKDTGCEKQILVKDTRESYAYMCSAISGHAHKHLKLIGVTGTNGKTTVTYLIKAILERAGFKTGLIGTNQSLIGDEPVSVHNTTPDPYELHGLLGSMLMAGCEYVVMEVSSHALIQKRVFGLRYDTAVFTNLTQDHLDYHETMEKYLGAKRRLFNVCDKGVFNYDDPFAREIMRECPCECVSFSAVSDESDYTAKNISYRADGVDFELVGIGVIGRVHFGTPGKFSVYNALAAGVAALTAGMPFTAAVASLSEVSGVKGRMEVVPLDTDYTVVIDYAHSPDALKNVIDTLRQVKKGRLVTLFGCGGDRDRLKRPKMGKIAAEGSDSVIVTSDNPRTEDPSKIIEDILEGMNGTETPYTVIENRKQAIEYAIAHAKPDDLILLAGKGHETYQLLDSRTIGFDERKIVADALEKSRMKACINSSAGE